MPTQPSRVALWALLAGLALAAPPTIGASATAPPDTASGGQPPPEPSPGPVDGALRCGEVVDDGGAWVEALLSERPEAFASLVADAEELRLQILVGEVIRGDSGAACVVYRGYRLGAEYFYPASALKTIGAVAALQTFRQRASEDAALAGLDVDTPLIFGALAPDGVRDAAGEAVVVSERARSTLRRELDRTLVVSSNEGFNRLYDVAGHDGLNQQMWAAGLPSVRMFHRLSRQGLPDVAHRMSPSVAATIDGTRVELLPERASTLPLSPPDMPRLQVGREHRAPLTGVRVLEPLSFADKNAVSLLDLTRIVAWVVDPSLAPDVDFDRLTEADRALLLEVMARVPSESARFKPFSPGVTRVVPWEHLRYVNKAGRAYGFHLDAAYVEDTRSGGGFFLAATILVNPNGVMNDGRYAYDEVSFPFLVALGEAVAARLLR